MEGVHIPAADQQLPPEYQTSADLQAGVHFEWYIGHARMQVGAVLVP